jgi:hypothetical protein
MHQLQERESKVKNSEKSGCGAEDVYIPTLLLQGTGLLGLQ